MPYFAKVYPLHGLNSKANEDGLPEPEATICQQGRFGRGGFQKRGGSVRVLVATGNAKCMDFDSASSEYISIPAHTVHALGTKFTIEVLVQPETVTGTQNIIGFNHATDFPFRLYMDAGQWRAYAQDSAGNSTDFSHTTPAPAAGVTTHLKLTRDGDLFSLYADGTLVNLSSMPNAGLRALKAPGGAMEIGRHNTANPWNGKIDKYDGFAVVRSGVKDRLVRFPDPKAEYVLWSYDMNASANAIVYDQSRFENHGLAVNTPAEATSLCHSPAPVRGIHAYTDFDRNKKMLVSAGGLLYNVSIP